MPECVCLRRRMSFTDITRRWSVWPGHLTMSTLPPVVWTWWFMCGRSAILTRGSKSQVTHTHTHSVVYLVVCFYCKFFLCNTVLFVESWSLILFFVSLKKVKSFIRFWICQNWCDSQCNCLCIDMKSVCVCVADSHRLHHVSGLAWLNPNTLVTTSHDSCVKQWTLKI